MDKNSPVGKRLKEIEKSRGQVERFIKTRMWFSTFLSYLYPDRVTIPDNIGNSVGIFNNQVVTKNAITEIVLVRELSTETPLAFTSKLTKEVKSKVPGVRVDFVFKNTPYYPDLSAGGLKSRINQWIRTLDNPRTSGHVKERAARLLYSVYVARTKEPLTRSYVYIYIRAEDGVSLKSAKVGVKDYLEEKKIRHTFVRSDMSTHLKFISLLSNNKTEKIKDIPYNVLSATNLAEILPVTQGINSDKGNFLGIDKKNRSPYHVDFKASAKAKNIYVIGPSGEGKTFLALNWALDAYALLFNICLMDLKGNEFSAFTRACNGITLSLRPEADQFVNTFKLRAKDAEDYTVYFNTRFELSKQQMLIMADLSESQYSRGEALIEGFLQSLYSVRGIAANNPNSWLRSESLNPYAVYEEFLKYMSADMLRQYADIADTVINRLSIYMSVKGSKSHMFRKEFVLEDVLHTKVLTFDFGMLNSSRTPDPIMFKLKVMFMRILNNEFVRYKKSIGEWTVKILEESQIAEDYLFKIYKEETTLRRSQNQVTVVLGNSISSLAEKEEAKAMLENFNMLCIGPVSKSGRDYLIREYGLEKHEKTLERIHKHPAYEHTFLFVNRLDKHATDTVLQACVPKPVTQGKIFKVVDVEED